MITDFGPHQRHRITKVQAEMRKATSVVLHFQTRPRWALEIICRTAEPTTTNKNIARTTYTTATTTTAQPAFGLMSWLMSR